MENHSPMSAIHGNSCGRWSEGCQLVQFAQEAIKAGMWDKAISSWPELHYQSIGPGVPLLGLLYCTEKETCSLSQLRVWLLYQDKCSWSCSLLFPTLETMDHHHMSNLNSDFLNLVQPLRGSCSRWREGMCILHFSEGCSLPLGTWGWGLPHHP